jgi:hypothetical protein
VPSTLLSKMSLHFSEKLLNLLIFAVNHWPSPELESDILKEPDTGLTEAANYPAVSVSSTWILPFAFLCFVF